MNLWIFGDSNGTGYNLAPGEMYWGDVLSQSLKFDLIINLARPAVDNFFIYQAILQECQKIAKDDVVIVGWSHPNRKTFLLDRNSNDHLNLIPNSFVYESHGREFFKFDGTARGNAISTALKLSPRDSGFEFFDNWFKHYYNEFEQKTQFQSFIDSINLRLPNTIHFFFSKESVTDIQISDPDPFCVLDFAMENKLYISKDDYHLNVQGHKQLANAMLNKINLMEKPNVSKS
jgi:lysophospholipase L1-like esterase